jgi:hypothetical protein
MGHSLPISLCAVKSEAFGLSTVHLDVASLDDLVGLGVTPELGVQQNRDASLYCARQMLRLPEEMVTPPG